MMMCINGLILSGMLILCFNLDCPGQKKPGAPEICSTQQEKEPGYDIVCVESWKKGNKRVEEQNINLKLDFAGQEYTAKVSTPPRRPKQLTRNVRKPLIVTIKPGYQLEVQPLRLGEGSRTTIAAVRMELYERKNFFRGLFSRERRELFFPVREIRMLGRLVTPRDFPGSFNSLCDETIVGKENALPFKCPQLPFRTSRIIKVDGFYCILRVTDYKLSESRKAFRYMSFQVEFINGRSID